MFENVTDAVTDFMLTLLFILLGFMNVVNYVNWCNSNVFSDNTIDKVKGEITANEPSIEDKVYTAEELVYMVKMKNNDYYMTCPTLAVYLYGGTDVASAYRPHSEYKEHFIEPQPNIEWDSYIDSWISNNINGKLYAGDRYRVNQRLWSEDKEPFMFGTGLSTHVLYPIECANTDNALDTSPYARYNPLYGRIPTAYMNRYMQVDYQKNPRSDAPHLKDMGYFYWTLEPYYE